jgi:quercetin dioxygenase-like cupin family protein
MNVKARFSDLREYFSPRIIGEVNDVYVKIVKVLGQDVPWHTHEKEDELFYIVDGKLRMEIENRPDLILEKGDLFVVSKGTNHRVSSSEECLIMLIEPKSTEHTGNVKSSITKSIRDQL